MKLLTKEIQQRIPPLYATEDVPLEDKICHVKYFAHWRWYAVEAEAICRKPTKPSETFHVPLKEFEDTIEFIGSGQAYRTAEHGIVEVVDVMFFGLVEGFENEWGYFNLSELLSIKMPPFGHGVERDMYTSLPKLVSEVKKS